MPHARLRALDLAYARFNAARTMGDPRPSQFRVEDCGSAHATFDPVRGDSYYNRIVGLDATAIGKLGALLDRYAELDLSPRIDAAMQGNAAGLETALQAALGAHGFEQVSTLTYLHAGAALIATSDTPELVPPLRIERWGPGDADRFLDLIRLAGSPVDAQIRAARRHHYGTDTFRTYVALAEEEPAAWATLFVHENMGFLGNANTLPAFRRRGLHRALIEARLKDAASLGLDWVVCDAEANTTSSRNCERAGLRPLTTHAIWERSTADERSAARPPP